MTKPLDILRKMRDNYKRQGKLIQAATIDNAMQALKRHGKQQETLEEVQAEAADTRPTDLCAEWVQAARAVKNAEGATDKSRGYALPHGGHRHEG